MGLADGGATLALPARGSRGPLSGAGLSRYSCAFTGDAPAPSMSGSSKGREARDNRTLNHHESARNRPPLEPGRFTAVLARRQQCWEGNPL